MKMSLHSKAYSTFVKKMYQKPRIVIRDDDADEFFRVLNSHTTDETIKLLKKYEVIQWLFGDLSFLGDDMAETEKAWGCNIINGVIKTQSPKGQWSGVFGEKILEEIFLLQGKESWKITKFNKKSREEPDRETYEFLYEVKTQSYNTPGTAGEKIFAVPFKYAELPIVYGKPLKIVCFGGAERFLKSSLSVEQTCQKRKFLDFYKEQKIEFIYGTDVLKEILLKFQTK